MKNNINDNTKYTLYANGNCKLSLTPAAINSKKETD
jgi:hypothetical protein